MTLGARVALLRAGAIEQVGAPLELYRRPANRFVATFLGSPAINFWPGRARTASDDRACRPEDVPASSPVGGRPGRGPEARGAWSSSRWATRPSSTLAPAAGASVARAAADLEPPPGAPLVLLDPGRALLFDAAERPPDRRGTGPGSGA